jgi:hypothetical protein
MRTLFQKGFVGGLLALAVAFASAEAGDKGEKKEGKPPVVGALAPHPLDPAFEKAKTEREITNALLNDPLFQKAVKDALNAKRNIEEQRRKQPNFLSATPAQAARNAFLGALQGKKDGE